MDTKLCNKCDEEKSIVDFHKDSSRSDGLCLYCKDCKNKLKKSYSDNNKDKTKEYMKKYYKENREHLLKYSKDRYKDLQ